MWTGSRHVHFRVALIVLVPLVVIIVIVFAVAFVFLVWLLSEDDIGSLPTDQKGSVSGCSGCILPMSNGSPRSPWQRSNNGRGTERQQTVMPILKAGVLYFGLVFAAGFVLGTIRTLWVVPHVGMRMAELLEAPIMLVVTISAARWTVLRLSVPRASSVRLGMGFIALALMLVAEFGFVLWIRGLSIREYLATRDPVSEAVYYVMLAVFAVMPLLVARR
jgi:type IV secretory pathway TrbD component